MAEVVSEHSTEVSAINSLSWTPAGAPLVAPAWKPRVTVTLPAAEAQLDMTGLSFRQGTRHAPKADCKGCDAKNCPGTSRATTCLMIAAMLSLVSC
jgi:hypothetical protein